MDLVRLIDKHQAEAYQVSSSSIQVWILFIKDIIHGNGEFLMLEELHARYGVCINQMQYNSIKSCIPLKWKQTLRSLIKVTHPLTYIVIDDY